ncbi:MAG: DUF2974 domain-containing protein [Clostridia bacterium]|nr:DUF2974 domain-containing protein [Clostridia bacterium]
MGTANGEWLDNATALSGIPQQNTYTVYENGKVVDTFLVSNDYAGPQQVEALNWFNMVCSKNGWDSNTNIIVSGHSKGGNKAQFITINSGLIDRCYSFDGQGFSKESIAMFNEKFGQSYNERVRKIQSYSTYDDYVNILGVSVVPANNNHYLEATYGEDNLMEFHCMESLVDNQGRLNAYYGNGRLGSQGELSEIVQKTNLEIMDLDPNLREPMVFGIMNMLQKSSGPALNGETVSGGTTAIGVSTVAAMLVNNLTKTKDGKEAIAELALLYGDDIMEWMTQHYNNIAEQYGSIAAVTTVIAAIGIACFFAPFVIKVTGFIIVTAAFVKTVVTICNFLIKTGTEIYNSIKNFCDKISNRYNKWIDKLFNGGWNYAALQQIIIVDTNMLNTLAARIEMVNKKVLNIDKRLEKICFKTNLKEQQRLTAADSLKSYSWRLASCKRYLTDTAEEFDRIEHTIILNIDG